MTTITPAAATAATQAVRPVASTVTRMLGFAGAGLAVTAGLALWADLYGVERDSRDAWAGVLSILLRDPDFLFY
jgi:hypothetical protein